MTVKNKRVLITGATGFIGANITRRLLLEGARVNIFTRKDSDKRRIRGILKDVSDKAVDLTDNVALTGAVRRIKPEIIVHTAVYGGYPDQKDFRKMLDMNFIATANLLNACVKTGFCSFVNSGSSSEYGIKSKPMKESDLLEPSTDYGVSKAAATLYCRAISLSGKLPVLTLRLFSPYGYYESPSRLIPYVIISFLKNRTVKLSSKENVRDFVFIDDVADAYMKAIACAGDSRGEIFNIGAGHQHSVRDVVEEISKITGKNTHIEWGSASNSRVEPKKWQADISKAKRFLGWEPRRNLRQGLDKLIEWFGQNMKLYE